MEYNYSTTFLKFLLHFLMSVKRSALFGDKGVELSDYVKRGENSKHSQSFLTMLRENFKK